MSSHRRIRAVAFVIGTIPVLLAACIGAVWLDSGRDAAVSWSRYFTLGTNDFLQFYAGANLIGTDGLYSPAANLSLHKHGGRPTPVGVYYSRPPFYAALLWPLGQLPFGVAYVIFQALGIVSLAIFVWLFASDLPHPELVGSCLAVLWAVMSGQDTLILLAIATGSVTLARHGRDGTSGALLALCGIKFHLFVFVPLVLLKHRRRRMLVAASAACAILIGLSFLSAGVGWPLEYARALRNPDLHSNPSVMPNLHGSVATLGLGSGFEIGMSALVAILVVCTIFRTSFEVGFGVALVGGLLTSYHAYLFDACLLLLAVPLLMRAVPQAAFFLHQFVGPVPYLLLLLAPTKALTVALLVLLIAVICARGAAPPPGFTAMSTPEAGGAAGA